MRNPPDAQNPLPPVACAGRNHQGVALVIILVFVVLLSGLVLAFFSRATSDRQVSNSSANEAKVDLFAQGALDTIVGDLKQEIAAGSISVVSGTTTIYTPKAPATDISARVGSDDTLPGLVKRSASGQPFFSGTNYDTTNFPPANRAANVSSLAPSPNGRFVSLARWNAHYLLPKKNATSDTDATPLASFAAPDWIMVSRSGSNPVTWSGSLNNATASNSSFVVGRYSYAIYDEGGLLDMNVAGFPSQTTGTQSGAKSNLAFADLTRIGLTQAQVDQIVGWRNYASVAPSGTFPSFTFNTAQAASYYNLVTSNTTGFLTTANQSLNSGESDRMFPSRQALIRMLVQGLGGTGTSAPEKLARATLQNSLQYMGTFSRDLDQPSFSPSASLPKVQAASTNNAATWGRGNDAYNATAALSDRYTSATVKSPYDINPQFPTVRVVTPFTRSDGTAAVAGDPLLKNRFPLSRLGLILRTATAQKDPNDPIYKNFGLYRASASDPWTYDHGDPAGILRLSYPTGGAIHQGVAQEGREPDFFELLKAAINVGSLAKSSWTGSAASTQYAKDQHDLDVLTALNILQIGANIIDQYDSDGYPTRIAFLGSPTKVVCGVEDLPYIYHLRDRFAFVSDAVGRFLLQPVMWNPNDPASGATADAPTDFRVSAQSVDPLQPLSVDVTYYNGERYPCNIEWDQAGSAYTPLTFKAGKNSGHYDFRQPTLVGDGNYPATANIVGNNFQQQWVDPSVIVAGVVVCDFPLRILTATNAAVTTYNNGIWPGGPSPGVNFITECKDGANWIPYDRFVAREETSSHHPGFLNTGVHNDTQARAALQANDADKPAARAIDVGNVSDPTTSTPTTRWWGMTRMDPRTGRFGPCYTFQYSNAPAILDRDNYIYETHRGGTGVSFSSHHNTLDDNGFTGAYTNYTVAGSQLTWYRGPEFGYWAENSIRDTNQLSPWEDGKDKRRFNRDPDGIVRRAMGGFATDTTQGGSLTQLNGLPLATNNFASRPLILNRPFKSVAELGYVFKGIPWKNLNFSSPESGDTALLDVFCIDEPAKTDGLVAGRVNLNTRQSPVLQAIFAGANVEVSDPNDMISGTVAKQLADALVARTSNTDPTTRKTPIASRAEIVGTWNPVAGAALATDPDPDHYFSGFSSDIGTIAAWNGQPQALINRKRESAIRALTAVGTARTWNLLIDVIAQSGHFGPSATKMGDFVAEGEKRYWLHISIDRVTGQILDRQLESVTQ